MPIHFARNYYFNCPQILFERNSTITAFADELIFKFVAFKLFDVIGYMVAVRSRVQQSLFSSEICRSSDFGHIFLSSFVFQTTFMTFLSVSFKAKSWTDVNNECLQTARCHRGYEICSHRRHPVSLALTSRCCDRGLSSRGVEEEYDHANEDNYDNSDDRHRDDCSNVVSVSGASRNRLCSDKKYIRCGKRIIE